MIIAVGCFHSKIIHFATARCLLQASNIFQFPQKNEKKHLAISAWIISEDIDFFTMLKIKWEKYLILFNFLLVCLNAFFSFSLFVALWLKSIYYYKVILFTLSFSIHGRISINLMQFSIIFVLGTNFIYVFKLCNFVIILFYSTKFKKKSLKHQKASSSLLWKSLLMKLFDEEVFIIIFFISRFQQKYN